MRKNIIFVEADEFGEYLDSLLIKGYKPKCKWLGDIKMYEIRY